MPAFGLFKRRELWVPTWRGWALILACLAGLAVTVLLGTVPFLAPVRPVNGGILVVEGWLPDYALAQAKKTFESHPYRLLVVTGVPIDIGFHISKEKNYAQLATGTLTNMGLSERIIVPITCPNVPKDRTYSTARKFKGWLQANGIHEPVDIFTLGVHARRTWLLYRMVLGRSYPTGIIAAADERYDEKCWWRTSSGFRTVTSEIIAYLYARVLFHPRTAAAIEPHD